MTGFTNPTGTLNQYPGNSPVADGYDRQGGLLVSQLQARYSAASVGNRLFYANAIVTAPVIFSTAAGTGGPLLWNSPSSGVNCQLLAVGLGISVVSTVAAALGLTGNTGQNLVPASTTAIDASGNCFMGGAAAKVNAYRVGTPTNAGSGLIPFGNLDTGALTTSFGGFNWIDLWGMFTFPPGSWMSIAASATASTTVMNCALIWTEIPV